MRFSSNAIGPTRPPFIGLAAVALAAVGCSSPKGSPSATASAAASSSAPAAVSPSASGAESEDAGQLRSLAIAAGDKCRSVPDSHCPASAAWEASPLPKDPHSIPALVSLVEDTSLKPLARAYAARAISDAKFDAATDPTLAGRLVAVAESTHDDGEQYFWDPLGTVVARVAMVTPEIADRVEALVRKHENKWLMQSLVASLLSRKGASRFGPLLIEMAKANGGVATVQSILALANEHDHLPKEQATLACTTFVDLLGDAGSDKAVRDAAAAGVGACKDRWNDGLGATDAWLKSGKTDQGFFVVRFLTRVADEGSEDQKKRALEQLKSILENGKCGDGERSFALEALSAHATDRNALLDRYANDPGTQVRQEVERLRKKK